MASPFAFGAPTSPFGFSTANAAAAPANTAQAFGAAASMPAFGAPNPATSFSFGNAGAAAPTATPAFGSAFGSGAAKPPAFGTFGAQSAPAFGASTGGAFAFPTSAPATSAPSIFGATSAPAFGAPTSAPSLFGAASAPSLFGASSAPAFGAPASAPSIFGSAPAPGAAGGIFGGTTAANIFGQPQQQQPQPNMFAAGGQAQLPGLVDPSGLTQDDAARALSRIRSAYDPNSADYRFQTLFVSVVERPEQRVKPPGYVDENRWRAALAAIKGPSNPQKLWPVVANGFADLNKRSQMQADAVAQNANRLRELQDRAAALSRRATGEFRSRINELQREHTGLSHRLLHVIRCVDALESRLALSAGYNAQQSRQTVADLSRQMGRLEEALVPAAAAAGLQRRLEAVAAGARMRAGSSDGASGGGLSSVKLDERSQSQLFTVLRDHAEAIRQLQAVLKQDELDVEVLKRLTSGSGAGPGGVGNELASAVMGGL